MWRPMWRRQRVGGIELRWLTARSWTQRWYPQGIDVGERRGRRALAVSWFRQDPSGRHLASRVTLVDRERARRLDIVLAVADDDGVLQPAPIHAGGLAWFGDRLFAAATRQGIWEFDLGALRRVHGTEAQRIRGGTSRRDRRTTVVAVRTRRHPVTLRCSFLGRVFDEDGTPLPACSSASTGVRRRERSASSPSPRTRRRLRRTRALHPGIRHMQGPCGGVTATSSHSPITSGPGCCGPAATMHSPGTRWLCPSAARIWPSTPTTSCCGRWVSIRGGAWCGVSPSSASGSGFPAGPRDRERRLRGEEARPLLVYTVLRLLAFLVPLAILWFFFPIFREFWWLAAIFAALIGASISMLFLRTPLSRTPPRACTSAGRARSPDSRPTPTPKTSSSTAPRRAPLTLSASRTRAQLRRSAAAHRPRGHQRGVSSTVSEVVTSPVRVSIVGLGLKTLG